MLDLVDDAELFTQLCHKHGILVESDVVNAVKLSCTTGILRLTHTSVLANLCDVLAQVLSSSSSIKVLDLSDCMLLPKGLTRIFKALCGPSSVSSLYLRGNNIGGDLAEELGETLAKNNSVRVLHVEWNNLGSREDSFGKFCDGLARNHCVEELDLRYNQVSTLCADALADALRKNRSLRKLNLEWNSLGTTGGQKLLQALGHNTRLTSLSLKGSCVPSDICSAINDKVSENLEKQVLFQSPLARDQRLRSPIAARGGSVLHSPSHSSEEGAATSRSQKKKRGDRPAPAAPSGNEDSNGLDDKLEGLNKILKERSDSIDRLKAELEGKSTELEAKSAENQELKAEIRKLQEEHEKVSQEKLKEVDSLKRIHAKAEAAWKESYRELEETLQTTFAAKTDLESKTRILEKDLRKCSLELQSTKDKFTSTIRSYEDSMSDCKLEAYRAKREFQEREAHCKIEGDALKKSLKETSEALEKCQQQLQKLRDELRESLEVQAKLKIRTDEAERVASRTARIEESLRKCREDRDAVEAKLLEARSTVATLQKQIIRLQEESIEPQKRYDSVKLELQLEREKSSNLTVELQAERARMREQTEQMQKMLGQVNALYAQLSEEQRSHAEKLREKDKQIDKTKDAVALKARELSEFKAEQIRKAQQFQAAVNKYLGSFGTTVAIT
ncbi:leucine-rich repeat-containing protein 45-like [Phymastichus coffea]|uniref:leucine-rich repeat-containing protein 45-like n=1 Tax=Phymastichus coffea TaxID=108790 RepID=UPI00273BFC83|nr:leucine-rich repeat-containing protein 45-like [Phymastichus coffea]